MKQLIIKAALTITLFFTLFFYVQALETKQTKLIPHLQHASNYKAVKNIDQYWISEKLDGIRGYWNGQQLFTRQGNIIKSPKWFTRNWPNTVMDGELWIARSQFQATLSCVLKVSVDNNCWQQVRFMIFDLPGNKNNFTDRIKSMKFIVHQTESNYLRMIEQFKVKNIDELTQKLNVVIKMNGEGLMLHKGDSFYQIGKSANLMKLKKHQTAQAIVISYTNGKGKYKGMLGALTVKTKNGIVFNIGTGFTDEERKSPPAIGSIIKFKYNGKTQANIPRFARYYREEK